jgi:hypothetical protein
MALDRTCKPKGTSLPQFYFKEIPRGFLLEHAVLLRLHYLKFPNNLDLEIKLMLPQTMNF